MKKRLPSLLTTLLSLLLAAPLPGRADTPPPAAEFAAPPPADMPQPFPLFPLHGLNLSEEQHDRIFALRHAAMPALHRQIKTLHAAEKELQALRLADASSDDALRSAGLKLGNAIGELAALQVQSERQILAVLTPEQRARLQQAPKQRPFPLHRQFPPPAEKFAGGPGAPACPGRPTPPEQ